jgi:hypothetical protein
LLGITVGVGKTIELDRKLTDDEWDRLVVDLRETFDRRGTVKQEGSFRQWTNGALQVLLEPTPTGQRVRMSTVKTTARAWLTGGMLSAGIAAIVAVAGAVGGSHNSMTIALDIAAIAAGQLAVGATQLSGWASMRRKQMDEIAQRLIADGR